MEPIVEFLLAPNARQDESVKDVFSKGGEQGATESDAKEDKKAGEVVDPHLQSLEVVGERRNTGRINPDRNVQIWKHKTPHVR